MLIVNVRVKIWDFFEGPDTKMCPSEMALKCISNAFWYIDLVKFFENLKNF